MSLENKNDITQDSTNTNKVPYLTVLDTGAAQSTLEHSTPNLVQNDKSVVVGRFDKNPKNVTVSASSQPSSVQPQKPALFTSLTHKIKRLNFKKIVGIVGLVVLFSVGTLGAYFIGKNDQKIVFQERPTQPLNLPPQAVVVAECVKGRGKQYVLPKDIPGGPIYDVVNDKVIAIEYNLNVSELVTNPDNFSDTILRLAKDYPIDHLSLIPVIPKDGGQVENALLVTFVVSKEEAAAVTCDSSG